MWNSYERYRSDKKHSPITARFLGSIAKLIAAVFVFVVILPVLFAGTLGFETRAMEPVFQPGDRVVYTPLAYGAQIFGLRLPGFGKPLRGDMVVVTPSWFPGKSFFQQIIDPVVEFTTGRNVSATSDRRGKSVSERIVLRVTGLPGDTVRIEGSKIFIRPENTSEYVPVQSLMPHEYSIQEPSDAEGDDLLFQEVREYIVRENEYFLTGDNRALFSDSRFQGPISFQMIQGKVFLRYWPFDRFGTP